MTTYRVIMTKTNGERRTNLTKFFCRFHAEKAAEACRNQFSDCDIGVIAIPSA